MPHPFPPSAAAKRHAAAQARDRLEALRAMLAAIPKAPLAQADQILTNAANYLARWPVNVPPAVLRAGQEALGQARQGLLARKPRPPAPQVLTVGALRQLLAGLPDSTPLTQVLADPATIAAVAQSLALVPPVARPSAPARTTPFQSLNSPEALGL